MRDDGGLDQRGSSDGSKKLINSGCILKLETTVSLCNFLVVTFFP